MLQRSPWSLVLALSALAAAANALSVPMRTGSILPDWSSVSPKGVAVPLTTVENYWEDEKVADLAALSAYTSKCSDAKVQKIKAQIKAYYDAADVCLRKNDMVTKFAKLKFSGFLDKLSTCMKDTPIPLLDVTSDLTAAPTAAPTPAPTQKLPDELISVTAVPQGFVAMNLSDTSIPTSMPVPATPTPTITPAPTVITALQVMTQPATESPSTEGPSLMSKELAGTPVATVESSVPVASPQTAVPVPESASPAPVTVTPISTTGVPVPAYSAQVPITFPPVSTTEAPVSTSASTALVTIPPVLMTQAPVPTYASMPVTFPPVSTTEAPMPTYASVPDTLPPVSTTEAPVPVSELPITSTPSTDAPAPMSAPVASPQELVTDAPVPTNAPSTSPQDLTTEAPVSTNATPMSVAPLQELTTEAPATTGFSSSSNAGTPAPTVSESGMPSSVPQGTSPLEGSSSTEPPASQPPTQQQSNDGSLASGAMVSPTTVPAIGTQSPAAELPSSYAPDTASSVTDSFTPEPSVLSSETPETPSVATDTPTNTPMPTDLPSTPPISDIPMATLMPTLPISSSDSSGSSASASQTSAPAIILPLLDYEIYPLSPKIPLLAIIDSDYSGVATWNEWTAYVLGLHITAVEIARLTESDPTTLATLIRQIDSHYEHLETCLRAQYSAMTKEDTMDSSTYGSFVNNAEENCKISCPASLIVETS